MAKITYLRFDGTKAVVDVKPGLSVMEGAVKNNVPGVDADCGGACATCHVFVHEDWVAKTGERSAMEDSMLDFAENVQPNSRLCCQIKVTEELDGLVIRLPESQHGTRIPGRSSHPGATCRICFGTPTRTRRRISRIFIFTAATTVDTQIHLQYEAAECHFFAG
jgi:2Fe-2S ferredoxin